LTQYRQWQPYLHDLGECEVKHGLRLHLVNLYKDNLGNPHLPDKLNRRRRWKRTSAVNIHPVITPRSPKYVLTAVLLLSAVALTISFPVFYRRGSPAVALSSSGKIVDGGLPIPEKSIAVLPFESRSEDKVNAYFADGIQDEILTRLSKMADLKVISRTSTQHYKSAPESMAEIARQLGVAHILEGSVQKSGDTVRVNVQLIKAANDSHLWADTFDRKLIDIFSVEMRWPNPSPISCGRGSPVRKSKSLPRSQQTILKLTMPTSRGLAYSLKSADTTTNALGAQKYLREAVRLDPKFALGWALLSYVDAASYRNQTLQPTVALREEARQAAETALTLQPNLGEALHAKGYYHYACLNDYDTAVRYFEQGRQLLPNSSRVLESLAYLERRRSQWDRSESYFNEAERLDPRNLHLLTQHASTYIHHVVYPKHCESLIRF
jgi:TolB-like protein/Tfp pilus assembly protein PilF